jgi:hypothetical protein
MLGTNGRPPPPGSSAFRNLWPPLTANLAGANTLQAGRAATFEIQANGEGKCYRNFEKITIDKLTSESTGLLIRIL